MTAAQATRKRLKFQRAVTKHAVSFDSASAVEPFIARLTLLRACAFTLACQSRPDDFDAQTLEKKPFRA